MNAIKTPLTLGLIIGAKKTTSLQRYIKLVTCFLMIIFSLHENLFTQALTIGEIYNYDIGDIFIRQSFSTGVPPTTTKTTITNKYFNTTLDTIFYTYNEYSYTAPACSLCTAIVSSTMGNTMFYTNLNDTITDSYNIGPNPYDSTSFCLDTNGFTGYWLNFSGPSTQYCSRLVSEVIYESAGIAGDSNCLFFFEPLIENYNYGKGIGQTLYEHNECAFGGSICDWGWRLMYYKKGSEECGDPLPLLTEVAVTNIDNNEHLYIYPSPAQNKITLEGISASTEILIEIIDVSGQIIFSKNTSLINELDITTFNNGVYFVRIFNEMNDKVYSSKFIKN